MVNLIEAGIEQIGKLDQLPPQTRREVISYPHNLLVKYIQQLLERSLEEGRILAKITEIDNHHPIPNPKISAVDFALIGKLYPHRLGKESYLRIINWKRDVWNGRTTEADKYTSGIQEAIGRKEPYYIVLEQPPKDIIWSQDEWESYAEKVARLYKGATFIIGNEINVPEDQGSYIPPKEYAEMFLRARRAIKKATPTSKLSLYGEAYFGQGETLTSVLEEIEKQKGNFGLRNDEKPFDMIAVHYYDSAKELTKKIEFYRQLLDQKGYSQVKIVVSELGIPLDKDLFNQLVNDEAGRATIMVQSLALCAVLAGRSEIEETFWFSMFSVADVKKVHGLYQQPDNDVVPTKNIIPFLLTNRLLQTTTGFSTTPDMTVVSGETTYQRDRWSWWRRRTVKTKVIWNNTFSEQKVLVSSRTVVYNLHGEIVSPIQGQINLPSISNDKPFIAGGEPVFLVEY